MSIQEPLYPELTCFGCGNANPHGFHLRSYREGDLTMGEFRPRPEHGNGFPRRRAHCYEDALATARRSRPAPRRPFTVAPVLFASIPQVRCKAARMQARHPGAPRDSVAEFLRVFTGQAAVSACRGSSSTALTCGYGRT
jgi:hypothetical protein